MIDDFLLTKISAGFLTLFYLFLSFRIGYFRGSPVMKLIFKMDKNISEKKLERNVRAHGNFSEYVPLFLILLFLPLIFLDILLMKSHLLTLVHF